MHAPVLCRFLLKSRRLPFPFFSFFFFFFFFCGIRLNAIHEVYATNFQLGASWNSRSLAIHLIAMPHRSLSSCPEGPTYALRTLKEKDTLKQRKEEKQGNHGSSVSFWDGVFGWMYIYTTGLHYDWCRKRVGIGVLRLFMIKDGAIERGWICLLSTRWASFNT